MSPSLDGPVQTQQAVAVLDGVLGIARSASGSVCTRMVIHRLISVQTDPERVLGIDLERPDNTQIVKETMQTMFDVSVDTTALVSGDAELQNILSEVRNDIPLPPTRRLQRSMSTPCLLLSSDTQAQVDDGLQVIAGLKYCSETKKIIKEIVEAIEDGAEPVSVVGGLGGAYYFRNTRGENVAIVKPSDEEPFAPNNPKGFVGKMLGQPGLKRAVRVGETGFREVAAYLLDHDHFAKVPPTVLIKIAHQSFHDNSAGNEQRDGGKSCSTVAKIASCQQFVQHDFDASDLGSSRFSVSAVHSIGILDIRIYNTDRHAGNILVRNSRDCDKPCAWAHSVNQLKEVLELIPIDHGLCLPEALEDPYFEWLHWPQASLPFSEEELDYIGQLDETKDVEMLNAELPMLHEACFRMLFLCTIFLKKTAAAGLCLAEIGEMMSRDGMEESSQLELLCLQAKVQLEKELAVDLNEDDFISEHSFGEDDFSEQFEFEMDREEDKLHTAAETDISVSVGNKYCPVHGRTECHPDTMPDFMPLRVEELNLFTETGPAANTANYVSPMALPFRTLSLIQGKQSERKAFGTVGALVSETTGKGSATGCSNPLSLSDIREEKWKQFVEYFIEILQDALESRCKQNVSYRQRLGISCQF